MQLSSCLANIRVDSARDSNSAMRFDQLTTRHLHPMTQKPSGASLTILWSVALIGAVAAAIYGFLKY